eukprot:1626703-Rhodomonas_salina.2
MLEMIPSACYETDAFQVPLPPPGHALQRSDAGCGGLAGAAESDPRDDRGAAAVCHDYGALHPPAPPEAAHGHLPGLPPPPPH